MSLERRITFFTENLARLAQASREVATESLAREGVEILRAWAAENFSDDELRSGPVKLGQNGADTKSHAEERMRIEGPEMWAEWHLRALAIEHENRMSVEASTDRLLQTPQIDGVEERKWLARFASRLPCAESRIRFAELTEQVFADGFGGYFAKTVLIHNRVNKRLNRQTLTIEEARRLWDGGPRSYANGSAIRNGV